MTRSKNEKDADKERGNRKEEGRQEKERGRQTK